MTETPVAQFDRFESIVNFRQFVDELIYFYRKQLSEEQCTNFSRSVVVRGTVKLHGTNGTICWNSGDKTWFQSRNRIVTPEMDNLGFAKFMVSRAAAVDDIIDQIRSIYATRCVDELENLMIAGEFCGKRIQRGVAVSNLPDMYVIFGIKINGIWQDLLEYEDVSFEAENIYNVTRAPVYMSNFTLEWDQTLKDIVLKNAEAVYQTLYDFAVEVENECPFAKTLGVSGTGEGIVWICTEFSSNPRLWFKTKGFSVLSSNQKYQ